MDLTPKQLDYLRSLKTLTDSDNVRFKEIIKKKLIDDPMIIYLLNDIITMPGLPKIPNYEEME